MSPVASLDAKKKASHTLASAHKLPMPRGFEPPNGPEQARASAAPAGHDFGRLPVYAPPVSTGGCPMSFASPRACPFGGACHTCPTRVQAKMEVGQPNDEYEREADEVANRVMRMPESCCSRRLDDDGRDKVRLKAQSSTPTGIEVTPEVEAQIQSLRGGGRPLSASERAFFEPRFGHDFSKVRIHADARAAEAAHCLNAKAFTAGQDVVFGLEQHSSDTSEGRKLLAHELVHAGQQSPTFSPQLHRKLEVDYKKGELMEPLPPLYAGQGTAGKKKFKLDHVRNCLKVLDAGHVGVDVADDGKITTTKCKSTEACTRLPKGERVTDHCICDMCSKGTKKWKIVVDDYLWPATDRHERIINIDTVGSVFQKGEWSDRGEQFTPNDARILGHELCGHAWLQLCGVHPTAENITETGPAGEILKYLGRPSHDPTVRIENKIATELEEAYGVQETPRGSYTSPHAGESFVRVVIEGFEDDDAKIPKGMSKRLGYVALFLKSDPELRAEVTGHAGEADANKNHETERRQDTEPRDNVHKTGRHQNTGRRDGVHETERHQDIRRRDDVRNLAQERAENVRYKLLSQGAREGQFVSVKGTDAPPDSIVDIFMYHYALSSESQTKPGEVLGKTKTQMDVDKKRIQEKLGI
jgi:outer membrane protein OmpA-like peptidoglycan-associated protein